MILRKSLLLPICLMEQLGCHSRCLIMPSFCVGRPPVWPAGLGNGEDSFSPFATYLSCLVHLLLTTGSADSTVEKVLAQWAVVKRGLSFSTQAEPGLPPPNNASQIVLLLESDEAAVSRSGWPGVKGLDELDTMVTLVRRGEFGALHLGISMLR